MTEDDLQNKLGPILRPGYREAPRQAATLAPDDKLLGFIALRVSGEGLKGGRLLIQTDRQLLIIPQDSADKPGLGFPYDEVEITARDANEVVTFFEKWTPVGFLASPSIEIRTPSETFILTWPGIKATRVKEYVRVVQDRCERARSMKKTYSQFPERAGRDSKRVMDTP